MATFLDRVATRILDLRDGKVESYTGNYTAYQQQKADAPAAAGQGGRAPGARDRQAGAVHRALPREGDEGHRRARAARRPSPRSSASSTRARKRRSTSSSPRTAAPSATCSCCEHDQPRLRRQRRARRCEPARRARPEGRARSGRTAAARARCCASPPGIIEPTRGRRRVGRARAPAATTTSTRTKRSTASSTVLDEVRSVAQSEPDVQPADGARAVPVPRRRCVQADRRALRRRAQPRRAGEVPHPADERAAARRADEPPRPHDAAQADRGARGVRRHDHLRQPRPGRSSNASRRTCTK